MIKVYTQPNCMPCRATMRALDAVDASYEVVDISKDEVAAERLKAAGYTSTPVVEQDGKFLWSGFHSEDTKNLAA